MNLKARKGIHEGFKGGKGGKKCDDVIISKIKK